MFLVMLKGIPNVTQSINWSVQRPCRISRRMTRSTPYQQLFLITPPSQSGDAFFFYFVICRYSSHLLRYLPFFNSGILNSHRFHKSNDTMESGYCEKKNFAQNTTEKWPKMSVMFSHLKKRHFSKLNHEPQRNNAYTDQFWLHFCIS